MTSTTTDRHANARERKRKRALENKTMRGSRLLFEVQRAVVKRGRKARKALGLP